MKYNVTREMVEDLNKSYGIDVVQELEETLVDQLSSSINSDIMKKAFALGVREKLIEEARVRIKRTKRIGKIDDIIS